MDLEPNQDHSRQPNLSSMYLLILLAQQVMRGKSIDWPRHGNSRKHTTSYSSRVHTEAMPEAMPEVSVGVGVEKIVMESCGVELAGDTLGRDTLDPEL